VEGGTSALLGVAVVLDGVSRAQVAGLALGAVRTLDAVVVADDRRTTGLVVAGCC
jgi:hypothetical protein